MYAKFFFFFLSGLPANNEIHINVYCVLGSNIYIYIYIYIYLYIFAVTPKRNVGIDRYRNISFQ
jgi:hypothetical protein